MNMRLNKRVQTVFVQQSRSVVFFSSSSPLENQTFCHGRKSHIHTSHCAAGKHFQSNYPATTTITVIINSSPLGAVSQTATAVLSPLAPRLSARPARLL